MEIKPIPPTCSALSLSGRKVSMSKQVKDLSADQVKDSLLELLEGYEDFVVGLCFCLYFCNTRVLSSRSEIHSIYILSRSRCKVRSPFLITSHSILKLRRRWRDE